MLAFAIDASWEERSDGKLEQELLIDILESIDESESGIGVNAQRMDEDTAFLRQFFNADASALIAFPRESFPQLTLSMSRANTFNVMEGSTALLLTLDIESMRK